MNKIIDIKNLSYKMHKREILKSINFYIPENSIAIFIGNNGAGKTTVIKSILNLIPYKQGTILLNQLNALSAKSRVGVGYLHEEELKINNISAQRFLYEQAKFCGITTNIINKKIEHYAQLFGISRDRLSMQVNYLSRGLKRILMIINAFITGTKLIVLDEPTEFLDPKSRNALNKAILDA
jgi:ABC-type multidrug transport system ATPase subunit